MKKLIINADDFGLHPSINNGIITAHINGAINSTSLMPSGQAFEHAITLLDKNPKLGVGLHLTLVGALPVSKISDIPSLVDDQDCLRSNYFSFLKAYLTGKINLREIRHELEMQVNKLISAGIHITHFDSHQHLHIFPGIIDITIELAKKFNITAIRIPDESHGYFGNYSKFTMRAMSRSGLTFFARQARKKAAKNRILIPDAFFGMLSGGHTNEEDLIRIVQHLPNGISEIMLHPGEDEQALNKLYNWNYNWQTELSAVMGKSFQQLLQQEQIRIVSFKELGHA